MASQAKEVEMLSTEELQRNQQLISQIYTQEVRNSQQSGTSFLQAMCKGVSLSYCSFYRPPSYQDSSHLISKFTAVKPCLCSLHTTAWFATPLFCMKGVFFP
jgi:hypothetical protein